MKKVALGLIISLFATILYAQMPPTEMDALRFSKSSGLYGSASSVGKAGAIGALGGDLSSAVSNPAGLGLFYRYEVSYSPMFQWNNTNSTYEGNEEFRNSTSARFGTFNSVFAFRLKNESSGFKAIQFSFGNNRINHFNNKTFFSGESYSSSMSDEWASWANGSKPEDLDVFSTRLAYDTYVIDTVGGIRNYESTLWGAVRQRKSIEERGGIWDYNVSFSANYDDFIYFGATLGLPDLYYRRISTYSENELDGSNGFDYKERNIVNGSGFNFKLGLIVRALDWLRIGAAFHSPTYYSIDDEYFAEMHSSIDGGYYESYSDGFRDSPSPLLEYSMRTPAKFIGSLAFVLGDQSSKLAGSISADYEYKNYASIRYTSDESFHANVNDWIKESLTASHTMRLGGQLNVGKTAFRLGYAYFSSPYKNKSIESAQHSVTAGLGYRAKWYYIDFAYAYSMTKSEPFINEDSMANWANVTDNKNTFILTLGFRF